MLADSDDDSRKYRAPALEKGLDVLELLSRHGGPLTPSQMSTLLGRSVSELFRMIQVLEFRGYIEPSPDGYRLTNRLFTLGMAQAPAKNLVDAALPVMRDLALATGQSCHLVVPTGEQIVVVARVEAPGDLGFSVRVGYRRNIIEATSGLLFYGCGSAHARRQLKDLLTPAHGARRVAEFTAAAEAAGARGYAERQSTFVGGITDLAAPVMGTDGILASMITPYIARTPPTCDMAEALARLRQAARLISDEVGALSAA